MLVQWLAEDRAMPNCIAWAQALDATVDQELANPASRTVDLGGTMGCASLRLGRRPRALQSGCMLSICESSCATWRYCAS
ncbi:protein of unknown function (plasmid) [Cupriavidus taiwanensis]|uniref:Uncharacterized protein n=1 Tax=Cupriavidus taiwanensis TaxID=164546 RepID=A0A375EGD5_9BURK|nr:protein of unknown function [Cupriavidus taiwanensis]SOZ72176.1 protein of unknown function [Cupriavidus taiwanensis]SOZ74474.1 protein of unknown function [Cupriavidus taiwanensis]SPA03381.1 protein of unknown function [Cupriavidus taiwanensis]SPA11392.1 protein of unknown function [Cupriavidus taiwanensis]